METHAREKFFGRRKGKKLRPNRVRLLEDVLPCYQIVIPAPCRSTGQAPAGIHPGTRMDVEMDPGLRRGDGKKWQDVWLEVGFGAGEHLAAQAQLQPEVLMIGCEAFINGVAKLCDHIDQNSLTNIRLFNDDARLLMDSLPDACLGRAFVLFGDPWPKTRHADRRFIGQANLDRFARLLRPGAELRLASDHPVLKKWMLQQARIHPAFRWKLDRCHSWLHRPADWPSTRYEQKALHGRPHFYTFVRV